MKARLVFVLTSLVLAASLSACATTRTLEVSGLVIDLEGEPVSGVSVEAASPNASGRTVSETDGQFTLEVTRRYTSAILPASGVFLDPVQLTVGDGEGDYGLGVATALNVDEVAQNRAITVVVPLITIIPIEALCADMPTQAQYAFALAENSAALEGSPRLRAYRDAGETEALLEELRANVRRAASDCALNSDRVETTLQRLERLFAYTAP